MANGDYFLVFLETSLDTRLVVCSTNDDTIATLKRKIEAEHLVIFPLIGEIIVRAIKTFRDGMMFHLANSMPVSAVLIGVDGNFLLYIDIEAVTTNDKRILRDGRVDKEVKVPIGGGGEDLMLSKAPRIDKEVFVDPRHDSAEDRTRLLNKTKKKKRKKNSSSENTALILEDLRKGKAEGFEGNSVQQEPGQTQDSYCGAHAGETNKSESRKGDWDISEGGSGEDPSKRKRRKKAKVSDLSKDASGAVGEPLKMMEIAHEASWEKEKCISDKNLVQDSDLPQIPGTTNLMEPVIPNPVEHTLTKVISSTTVHAPPNDEAGETKRSDQAKGDATFCDQPDVNQMPGQGREVSGDPAREPNQNSSNYDVAKSGEEQARRDDTKKALSPQAASEMIDAVLGGVTRHKKKHKKTKGFFSDVASEVPTIRENEPQAKDNIQVSEKIYSKVPEKPGGTTETRHSVSSMLYKSKGDQEGISIADKDIGFYNQPQNDRNVVSDVIQQCGKENADGIVLKVSANEVGGNPGFISPEKKKRKKTKAAFLEASSQELSSRENRSYKGKAPDAVLGKETSMAGDTSFINNADNAAEELKHDIDTSGMDATVKEKSRKKHKKTKGLSADIPCEVPPIREDEYEKADDEVYKSNRLVDKERNSEIPLKSAEELKLDIHTSGVDEVVKQKCRKKHKKKKGSSSDILCEVPQIRGDESEKADFKVHEGNQLVDKKRNSDIPVTSAEELRHDTYISGMTESVQEKSKKKRKKTKGSYPDIPCDVPPIRGDESEKADDKVHEGNQLVDNERNSEMPHRSAIGGGAETDNSVPCRLDKKRLQPQISSPADEDRGFHDQLRPQSSMGDRKDESRKDVGFSKEAAHITGGDPGGFSVEKKSRKKKKAASNEGLDKEARDDKSCPKRENDTILEEKTSKEAVDTSLIRITVEDPGVTRRGKRKHKKTKAAAADVSSRERSSTNNDSSKERKSSLILEKEASNETGDSHYTKNAGDVAFPAPNGADPDDSVNKIVSGVLADLRERIPLDKQISEDAEPHMQLLASMAVDQHKAEQASGLVVKAKKERKSKIESSNKTETSQDTTNLVTGGSVIAPDEKKRHKTAEVTSLPSERENGIDIRESFVLASSPEDGARNQILGSIIEEDSVIDGNKKEINYKEAKTLGPEATVDGAALEAKDTIKDSVTQTDGSGKIETQTMIKKSVKGDNVAADLTFRDKKSSKCKPKEGGVTDKHGFTSFAEGTTENAPTTPEKMQKSVDNLLAEKQDKEAFAEGIQTKGPAIFHKINFLDYFLSQPTNQPSDATSPLKETKVNKKIQNSALSKDESKSHISLSNNVSKRDDKMKCLVANMAVMSDASSEDEEEVNSRLKRPMSAVRKVSAKRLGEKVHASRKNSAMASSGSCFDDLASEALTRDENGSANKDSSMPEKKKGGDMMSPSSCWKDDGIAEDELPISHESTKSTKKVDLSSVLMSSSCYKRAEASASQSQAEDRDMIDMVFETQPDDLS